MTQTATNDTAFKPVTLGRTGLTVGRLGIAGGLGLPADAVEMAVERGCNYLYHGSLRRKGMTQAIKNLCGKGKREELVIVAQIYARWEWWFRRSFYSFLKKNGLDYVDCLLLGWHNHMPSQRILAQCAELKEKKLFRYLAVSGHNRKFFPELAKTGLADIFHIRYNAAHTGAEQEIFPNLPIDKKPGIVIYTATSWGQLRKPKNVPNGERTPTAPDCYRFVLSNPSVDVCITGPSSMKEMKENLAILDLGPLSDREMAWMRTVGSNIRK